MSYAQFPKNLDAIALGMGPLTDAGSSESSVQREMPKYVSHKTVWALKIAEIRIPDTGGNEWDGRYELVPSDEGYGAFLLDHEYWSKHQPQVGGYYVVYGDGYKSFSPADAFDQGYTRI